MFNAGRIITKHLELLIRKEQEMKQLSGEVEGSTLLDIVRWSQSAFSHECFILNFCSQIGSWYDSLNGPFQTVSFHEFSFHFNSHFSYYYFCRTTITRMTRNGSKEFIFLYLFAATATHRFVNETDSSNIFFFLENN